MEISAREILKKAQRRKKSINELKNEFSGCVKNFKKARKQIQKCLIEAMNRGLSQREIMVIAEKYFTKDCELCNIIVILELMRYEFKKRNFLDYEL